MRAGAGTSSSIADIVDDMIEVINSERGDHKISNDWAECVDSWTVEWRAGVLFTMLITFGSGLGMRLLAYFVVTPSQNMKYVVLDN